MQVKIADRSAYLPMDCYEAEQLLYNVGLDGPGAEYQIEMLCNYSGVPLDVCTNFRALNRLAWLISDMGDQRETFWAWCGAQDSCSVEEALKAACNIRLIDFFPGFDNDADLGEHALNNFLVEEYNDLPDEEYAKLNRVAAGARFREQEGGLFVDGGFLAVDEDFPDVELPAEEPLARFQAWFSNGGMDSGWLDVPLSEADERFVCRCFDCENLENLHMECRSSLPQLESLSVTLADLQELRGLNETLAAMSGEDIQKFKALAEVLGPRKIEHARWLAGELDSHTVELAYADPAAYARDYLAQEYSIAENDPLLGYIDLAALGRDELQATGYRLTSCGAVLMGGAQEMAPAEQSMRLAMD